MLMMVIARCLYQKKRSQMNEVLINFDSWIDGCDGSIIKSLILESAEHCAQIVEVNFRDVFVVIDNGPMRHFDSMEEANQYYGNNYN